MNKRLEKDIKQELLELNFNPSNIGIIYWIDAIRYAKEHIRNYQIMDIYEYIAKKHNSTINRVERDMRYTLGFAKKKIQEKYNYYDKITPSVFLGLIRFKLL